MNRNEKGFTLIEILVVVAILATLMGLVALIIPLAERKKLEFQSETRITSLRTERVKRSQRGVWSAALCTPWASSTSTPLSLTV